MYMKLSARSIQLQYLFATLSALLITFLTQYSFGRTIICKCGYIKIWQSEIWSSENSQHISDWYTFSHIIHGFAFFYISKLFKRLSLFQTFIIALIIETGWEIIENSSFIINRYRESTLSLDYYGDSILNSSFDILAMVLGFYIAKKIPAKYIIVLIIIMELGVGYWIRDNLTLNIIMLIFPLDSIKNWQLAS